ncbi:MAG: AAA family ATPase [Methanomicrobiales archaeon]|nr:AAA family ATPase [Methanomicrobiales archaeon]
MMYGITGTPGTGKSSIARVLQEQGFRVLHLSETTGNYVIEEDPLRETMVIDEDRWAAEFVPFDGVVEGHLAHLLPCDRVAVLRCRPDVLAVRLQERGYGKEKVRENALAEALDVVLVETLELFSPEQVYELDTTDKTIQECCDRLGRFFRGEIQPQSGFLDWSSFIGMIE